MGELERREIYSILLDGILYNLTKSKVSTVVAFGPERGAISGANL